MDRAEIDRLVERLVDNPHDEEALAYAHHQGSEDPRSYAALLERVGQETIDPGYAAHWLAEAANVWLATLNDAHRAARLLMTAIDKDPSSHLAAERLAQLYRDKGDAKALVALLERRSKTLAPLAAQSPELVAELAGMYEELGRLWTEEPLAQPRKAVEAFQKAYDLDPTSAYAIFNLRELHKSMGQFAEAAKLYEPELRVETDPARRVALLRDEAATRKAAGDLVGSTQALSTALAIDDRDPALQQELAGSILDRVQAGENVAQSERQRAVDLLVGLAETYDGDHGLAYAAAALDVDQGNDRALQLFAHYAGALGRDGELEPRYAAYLAANPTGAMASDVRQALAATGHRTAQGSAVSISDVELVVGPDDGPAPKLGRGELTGETTPGRPPARAGSVHPPRVAPGASVHRDAPDSDSSISLTGASERLAPARTAQLSREQMQGVLDAAQMLAGKGKKTEAFAKYKEALDSDPAHAEALAWVEDYLRSKRDYAQLREVLWASVRATATIPEALETRKERLREIAGLCEGNLRDADGAISAWRQLLALDRVDESARNALTRLLEKSQRWDDLANLLEQEATVESDVEIKVMLERKLARLNEDKRKDLVGAGEAWSRIARLLPDDEQAMLTASRLYEKGERRDLAAQILADGVEAVSDPVAKGAILQRLAELREELGETIDAGMSYAQAADVLRNARLWEEAERLFCSADAWSQAANAAYQRGLLTGDSKTQAAISYRASEYLGRAGEPELALARLEDACDLDPLNDDYASTLVARYTAADQVPKLVSFLTKRGDRLVDRAKRLSIRREAATLCSARLNDRELARELWLKVLEDGDDREALEKLIDDAVEREDHTEAATLLRRLGGNITDKAERARVALREAELLAEGVGDIDTAISRYEVILAELDPTCRPALQAIADLQEQRGELGSAADALDRELKLVADVHERGQIAGRLARMYEQLDDPKSAIRALDLVRKADAEDFDALVRLCELCEVTEQWSRVAELLVERIEIEGDELEVVELTKKLAIILADKLERGDEALGALTDLADQGEASVREAYIQLGDRLGWKGIVASKLKEWWFDARHGAERTEALRGAFERFAEVGRDQDAVVVATELIRGRAADQTLAERLEDLAVKTGDSDALVAAHELLGRERHGYERAAELVRQAEVQVKAGLHREDAIQHGESGLGGLAPAEVEPLLERLAELAAKPADVIDLYERQVTRSKDPRDRVRALGVAAQVSAVRGQVDRARGFFELALSGAPAPETLEVLETIARDSDKISGGDRLRRALCQAMSAGGHGARDGGRSRAQLLRRAAKMVHRELGDLEQAFTWLADALVAHVDNEILDHLEALALEVGDAKRAEAALSHALSEVFDGPLVRQLLTRRAKIRRDLLADPVSASADLKKLHDLSPHDQSVLDELAYLLIDLGDFRALVQLYEDQILRGKDMGARAELARKVARVWEEQLKDAREAADAWRRVLRMKSGDTEASAGLERAKGKMLRKPDPTTFREAYAPPRIGEAPPRREPRPAPRAPGAAERSELQAGEAPSAREDAAVASASAPPAPSEAPGAGGAASAADGSAQSEAPRPTDVRGDDATIDGLVAPDLGDTDERRAEATEPPTPPSAPEAGVGALSALSDEPRAVAPAGEIEAALAVLDDVPPDGGEVTTAEHDQTELARAFRGSSPSLSAIEASPPSAPREEPPASGASRGVEAPVPARRPSGHAPPASTRPRKGPSAPPPLPPLPGADPSTARARASATMGAASPAPLLDAAGGDLSALELEIDRSLDALELPGANLEAAIAAATAPVPADLPSSDVLEISESDPILISEASGSDREIVVADDLAEMIDLDHDSGLLPDS